MTQITQPASGNIRISVNGETQLVAEGCTLLQLVETMSLQGKRFAVERNQEIVPKSTLHEVVLEDNDVLEIVHAIGGG